MTPPIFVPRVEAGDPDYDAVTAAIESLPTTKPPALPPRTLQLAHHPSWVEATRELPRPPVERVASDRDLAACGAAVAAVVAVLGPEAPQGSRVAVAVVPTRSGPGPKAPLVGVAGQQAYNVPAVALAYAKHLREKLQKLAVPSRLVYIEGHGPLCPSSTVEVLHRRLISPEVWSFTETAAGLFAEDVDLEAMDASSYGLIPGVAVPWLARVDFGLCLRALWGWLRSLETGPAPHLVVYEAGSVGLGAGDGCIRASEYQLLLRDKYVIEACIRNDWPLVVLASRRATIDAVTTVMDLVRRREVG